jgi:hypothetical protein
LEEFIRLQEFKPTDRGFVRVRLVVTSSCTVVSFYFLGRGRTDGRTRVVFRGGPTNARKKERYPHIEMRGIIPLPCMMCGCA